MDGKERSVTIAKQMHKPFRVIYTTNELVGRKIRVCCICYLLHAYNETRFQTRRLEINEISVPDELRRCGCFSQRGGQTVVLPRHGVRPTRHVRP